MTSNGSRRIHKRTYRYWRLVHFIVFSRHPSKGALSLRFAKHVWCWISGGYCYSMRLMMCCLVVQRRSFVIFCVFEEKKTWELFSCRFVVWESWQISRSWHTKHTLKNWHHSSDTPVPSSRRLTRTFLFHARVSLASLQYYDAHKKNKDCQQKMN